MKKNLFVKFFFSFSGLILTVCLIQFIILKTIVRNEYIKTSIDRLRHLSELTAVEISPLLERNLPAETQQVVREKSRLLRVRITIVAAGGAVLADSDRDSQTMENHADRLEIRQALEGKPQFSIRFSATTGKEMLYYALPLRAKDKMIGAVRLSYYLAYIDSFSTAIRKNATVFLAFLMILSLVISWLLARSFSRPIRRLTQAARSVASGNFDSRVAIDRQDEIGNLAYHFNDMVHMQKNLVTSLKERQDELSALISSVSEGLIVLDPEGKIIRANSTFTDWIAPQETLHRPYWEVIRLEEFDRLVRQVQETNSPQKGEIIFNNRNFILSLSPVLVNNYIVIIFHDVSEQRRLEKIKRDFVANVSHELRTPLTAIKGYVETIEDHDNMLDIVERLRYIKIISRHTDRLIALTNDLLILHELEGSDQSLQVTTFNLCDVIQRVIKIFEKRSSEKHLPLIWRQETCSAPVNMQGDPFKIEQLLINLIDNAIKYTEKGQIEIRVRQNPRDVELVIQDTGCGIPAEHLPRIFERFYVVNKARSRELGGTGLGLSIVKHIVQLHGGKINVTSTPGAGTAFTLLFPTGEKGRSD